MNFDHLPGGALVRRGLEDLAAGRESDESLLVLVGGPRLRSLGIPVPQDSFPFVEHRLYERIAERDSDAAHSRYKALIRILVSFARSLECAR